MWTGYIKRTHWVSCSVAPTSSTTTDVSQQPTPQHSSHSQPRKEPTGGIHWTHTHSLTATAKEVIHLTDPVDHHWASHHNWKSGQETESSRLI
jgi:hypothetical protein